MHEYLKFINSQLNARRLSIACLLESNKDTYTYKVFA